MKVKESIMPEEATGLRDVVYSQEVDSVLTELINYSISIKNLPNSTKLITITYKRIDTDLRSGVKAEKRLSYKMMDEPQVDEYEIDEEGNEIEGTRVTVKEASLKLTQWDALVGETFEQGLIQGMALRNGFTIS